MEKLRTPLSANGPRKRQKPRFLGGSKRVRAENVRTAVRLDKVINGNVKIPPIPKNRGECVNGERPCLHLLCKHNLFADVDPDTGALTVNNVYVDPTQMRYSCSLDVADEGEHLLEPLALIMGMTEMGVGKIIKDALAKAGILVNKDLIGNEGPIIDFDDQILLINVAERAAANNGYFGYTGEDYQIILSTPPESGSNPSSPMD
jgi:hypothetical protein